MTTLPTAPAAPFTLKSARISAIVPDGRAPCVCIAVAHPSKLYITRSGIVTHNTTVAQSKAAQTPEQRQFAETEKAIGGKPAYEQAKAAGKTKLNYGQWVQVRTPNFKAWFGDWEAVRAIQQANAQVKNWINGNLAANVVIDLGRPSSILAKHGVPNLPITLKQSILRKATDGKHGIDKASLRDLAGAIQNPLAIFDDPDHANTRVVLTEVRSANGNVIAALRLNQSRNGLEINDVRSVHPKRDESVLRWVNDGLLLGLEKNKGRTWLENLAATNSQQPQALATLDEILYDGADLSSASEITDPDTGEPMVVYHGTGQGGFDIFSRHAWHTAYGHFFTPKEEKAKGYSNGREGNPQVYVVYLDAKNPLRIDQYVEDGYGSPEWMQEWARDEFDPEYGDPVEQMQQWLRLHKIRDTLRAGHTDL